MALIVFTLLLGCVGNTEQKNSTNTQIPALENKSELNINVSWDGLCHVPLNDSYNYSVLTVSDMAQKGNLSIKYNGMATDSSSQYIFSKGAKNPDGNNVTACFNADFEIFYKNESIANLTASDHSKIDILTSEGKYVVDVGQVLMGSSLSSQYAAVSIFLPSD